MRYALYSYQCSSGHTTKSWQWSSIKSIKCQTKGCKKKSYPLIHKLSNNGTFKPTVYYRNHKGEIYTPSSGDRPVPKRLKDQGYEKVEIRTIRDRDRFYREMSSNLKREHEEYIEQEQRGFDEMMKERRSELRQKMQHFSPFGRDFAQYAMDRNDAKTQKPYDAGFHIEAWE